MNWKYLSTRIWKSLETDLFIWRLIDDTLDPYSNDSWQKMYRIIENNGKWHRTLKTPRFECQVILHQIPGMYVDEKKIPSTLIANKRLKTSILQNFVVNSPTLLYVEPESGHDSGILEQYVEYLKNKSRVGAVSHVNGYDLYIPPCDYLKKLCYHGPSMIYVPHSNFD